jgi:hypothetical protein
VLDDTPGQEIIACLLTDEEHKARESEVAALFKEAQQTQELADGYAFQFPGDETWAARLVDFITFERACCPFFIFELRFEAHGGPVWLHIRGAAGVKEIASEFIPVR